MVVLIERAVFLRDEPESGARLATEIPLWRRYDNAKFVYDAVAMIATISLEIPVARSAAAAVGEARDAVYRFLVSYVREAGDYEVKALSVQLLNADM